MSPTQTDRDAITAAEAASVAREIEATAGENAYNIWQCERTVRLLEAEMV